MPPPGVVVAPGGLSLTRLREPAFVADPHLLYRRFQAAAPLVWDAPMKALVATTHAAARLVLMQGSAARLPPPGGLTAAGLPGLEQICAVLRRQMLFLDGPVHRHARALVAVAFRQTLDTEMEQQVICLSERFLQDAAQTGQVDLMRSVVRPLVVGSLARILGLPASEELRLTHWAGASAALLGGHYHTPAQVAEIAAALDEACSCLRRRLGSPHGTEPGLIARLARESWAEEEADQLLANLLLLISGIESSSGLVGGAMLRLSDGALHTQLREQPDLLPSAVEEIARLESPSQYTSRLAREGMEIEGLAIPPGTTIIALIAAANRDPAVFCDPDALSLARVPNSHLAFGIGEHRCAGAALGRLFARSAIRAAVCSLSRVKIAKHRVTWRRSIAMRSADAMPAEVTVRAKG